MKKLIFSSIIALAFLASCGGDSDKGKSDSANDTAGKAVVTPDANGTMNMTAGKYQCPMKCEGEKMYDSAGKCPSCKMDMKEMK
ncbi:hypothetical protein BH09BAC5_BH09BAC5_18650 [soil metagenome]